MRSLLLGACVVGMAATSVSAQPFPLTGIPPGATPLEGHNSKGFPALRAIPGQPVETRPPELPTDTPAFAGQTRAPYRGQRDIC